MTDKHDIDLTVMTRESLRTVHQAPSAPEPPYRIDEEWDIEQSKTRDCMYPRMCLPTMTDNVNRFGQGAASLDPYNPYNEQHFELPHDYLVELVRGIPAVMEADMYTTDGLIDIRVEEPWWKDVEYRVTPDGTCVTWPAPIADEPVDRGGGR